MRGVNEALTSSRMSVHSFNTVTVNFPTEPPRANAQCTLLSVCGSQHQSPEFRLSSTKWEKSFMEANLHPEHAKDGMMKTLAVENNHGLLATSVCWSAWITEVAYSEDSWTVF